MIDVQEFNDIKSRVERFKADKARAEGALESQMKQIKSEFQCDTLLEAEAVVERLKREEVALEAEYNEKLKPVLEELKARK